MVLHGIRLEQAMVNPDRVLKALKAIKEGDAKTLRMMLKGGVPADHHVQGTSLGDQCSLAHYAAKQGADEIFAILIEAGANIDSLEQYSWRGPMSMLESACSANRPSLEIVRRILSEGQPTDEHHNQALLAASYGQLEIVVELLAAGANPNMIDSSFDTPLIVAVLAGQEEIALLLVEAGADASLQIQNKDRSPFWKKSIRDAAQAMGMERLLSKCASIGVGEAGTKKKKSTSKPKTVEACWKVIDQWLLENLPEIKLPLPFNDPQLTADAELWQLPVAEQVRESFRCHDGTGQFSMIVIPHDGSFSLLSMTEAISARRDMEELCASEVGSSNSKWWKSQWWPIAENGAGDYLIMECGEGKLEGEVLKFSHETRRTSRYKKSMLSMLQEIAVDLENGSLSYDQMSGGLV